MAEVRIVSETSASSIIMHMIVQSSRASLVNWGATCYGQLSPTCGYSTYVWPLAQAACVIDRACTLLLSAVRCQNKHVIDCLFVEITTFLRINTFTWHQFQGELISSGICLHKTLRYDCYAI